MLNGRTRIEWVVDDAGFAELEARWDRLADEGASPFVRHAWFRAWWHAFGRGTLAVATAWDGDELVAALPLERRRNVLSALTNEHSPSFAPLGRTDAVALLLEAAIRASRTLALPSVSECAVAAFRAVAAAQRRPSIVQTVQVQPVVRLEPDWESYRRGLDRRWRKDVERRRRRLEEELAPSYLVLEEPHDLAVQLDEGFRAEAAGWKGRGGTAIRHDERAERFYRDVAASFAAAGRFRISAIAVGDEYAAFDFCLLDRGGVWIPKGGFNEAFRRFAPGLVLTLCEIERAFELGAATYELLGEPVPWKLRLANDTRRQCYAAAFAVAPVPLARYAGRRTWPLLRRVYRRVRPPR